MGGGITGRRGMVLDVAPDVGGEVQKSIPSLPHSQTSCRHDLPETVLKQAWRKSQQSQGKPKTQTLGASTVMACGLEATFWWGEGGFRAKSPCRSN